MDKKDEEIKKVNQEGPIVGDPVVPSYALNPKLTVQRGLTSIKLKVINFMNRVDDGNTRFGSCNEFTMGLPDTKTPDKT